MTISKLDKQTCRWHFEEKILRMVSMSCALISDCPKSTTHLFAVKSIFGSLKYIGLGPKWPKVIDICGHLLVAEKTEFMRQPWNQQTHFEPRIKTPPCFTRR